MRPAMPARQFRPRRNQRCRSCASRAGVLRPGRGRTTRVTPRCWAARSFVAVASLPSPATSFGGRPNCSQCTARLGTNWAAASGLPSSMRAWVMLPPSASPSHSTRPNSVGLPALPVRMIAVCTSKILTSFSPALTFCPSLDPPRGLVNHLLDTRHEGLQRFGQTLGGAVSLLLKLPEEMLQHLLRQSEQLLIAVLHVLGRLFAPPAGGIDQLVGHAPN